MSMDLNIAIDCHRGLDGQMLFGAAVACRNMSCKHFPDCVASVGMSFEPTVKLCVANTGHRQLRPECHSYEPLEPADTNETCGSGKPAEPVKA